MHATIKITAVCSGHILRTESNDATTIFISKVVISELCVKNPSTLLIIVYRLFESVKRISGIMPHNISFSVSSVRKRCMALLNV